MFNSKSYYTEEDAILANVEADLSYDGADGLCRAIMESYENERIINTLQEDSSNSIIDYIIDIMRRFWAKLKGMFMRWLQMIKKWMAKRKLKSFNMMEKERIKKTSSDASFTLSDDFITILSKKKDIELDFSKLDCSKITKSIFDEERPGYLNINDSTSEEEINGILIGKLLKVPSSKVSNDSLKSDIRNIYFDDDDIRLNKAGLDKVVKVLSNGERIIKDAENVLESCSVYIKNTIKHVKSSDSKKGRILSRVVRIINNLSLRVSNIIFNLLMEYISSNYTVYKRICYSIR